MKGMKIFLIVMFVSFIIAGAWDKVSIIKEPVHFVLDPTFGALLNWDLLLGMIIIVLLLNLVLVLIHKYTTDQEKLKSLKDEQKKLREEMKQLKDQPEKLMELQKKQMSNMNESMFKSFDLVMKPLLYTFLPIILFFRWFNDFFIALQNPKIFIGLGWFGTYIIFSIIANLLLRKALKVY